jgi:hypothetical protein
MKKVGLLLFSLVVAIGLLFGGAGTAKAVPIVPLLPTIVDFNDGSTGAPLPGEGINYNPLVSPDLIGMNMPVQYTHIENVAGPVVSITGGMLSFTTGPLIAFNPVTGTFTFGPSAPGNPLAFTVTGTIGAYTGLLYSAEMLNTTVLQVFPAAGVVALSQSGPLLGTFIAPAVVAALGLPGYVPSPFPGSYTAEFYATLGAVAPAINFVALSGGHVQAPVVVPVPPSVLFLAPGLLGLLGLRKRFFG